MARPPCKSLATGVRTLAAAIGAKRVVNSSEWCGRTEPVSEIFTVPGSHRRAIAVSC